MLVAISGEHDVGITSRNEQERTILNHTLHPNYSSITQVNDIALILLDRPLEFNQFTRPIRIATSKPALFGKFEGIPHEMAMKETIYF